MSLNLAKAVAALERMTVGQLQEQYVEAFAETYLLRDEEGWARCVMQWPQVYIANKLAQQLTRLEQEFGLRLASVQRPQELLL